VVLSTLAFLGVAFAAAGTAGEGSAAEFVATPPVGATPMSPPLLEPAVLDVRIDGTHRRIVLRDRSGQPIVGDQSDTPTGRTAGAVHDTRRSDAVANERSIRIVGGQAATEGAYEPADAHDRLPKAYDPRQDPYVQYPELLDPDYQPEPQ
jgi:hypothetical protein